MTPLKSDSKKALSARRYPGLTLRILSAEHPAMGPGKAQLIELIAKSGSISAAARELGMSYRRAWVLVAAINASFKKPVVLTATGGKKGGGTQVTPYGLTLVARFREMEVKASQSIQAHLHRFNAQLKTPLKTEK